MPERGERLRIGIIGCGKIARLHAERLVADDRVRLALVCDAIEANARAMADEFARDAIVATDAGEAVRCGMLDAVVVASPTALHYEHCRAALEAGLDVLCEKPLAVGRGQILDLIARRDRLGRVLSVGYQRRYKAAFQAARRELLERRESYGEVREVLIAAREAWQPTIAGTWRDSREHTLGYFADGGIHQVDVARFVTGQAARAVTAESSRRGSNVEIATRVVGELENGGGFTAHFVGDAHHFQCDIHVYCERADLLLRGEELYRACGNRLERIADLGPSSTPDAALVDEILDGTPGLSPAETALYTHDWTQAVARSIEEARRVDVGETRKK